MPPPPQRHTPRGTPQPTTVNDSDTEPTWNTATATVPSFLAQLAKNDSFLTSTPGLLSLWTRGYGVDRYGKKIVESYTHIIDILDNKPATTYTFEKPSPVGAFAIKDKAELDAALLKLGLVAPAPLLPLCCSPLRRASQRRTPRSRRERKRSRTPSSSIRSTIRTSTERQPRAYRP